MTDYVAYLRVSTDKQGASGLGLDAQKQSIKTFLKTDDRLLGYHIEIESGKSEDRPELQKALTQCQVTGATLLVAKLDRLSRNLAFVASMMESKTKFVACDMPGADPLRLHIEAAVAEDERRRISRRTKEALAAAKARGVLLGGARHGNGMRVQATREKALGTVKRNRAAFIDRVRPTFIGLINAGFRSTRTLAAELNRRNVKSQRGHAWYPQTVARAARWMDISLEVERQVGRPRNSSSTHVVSCDTSVERPGASHDAPTSPSIDAGAVNSPAEASPGSPRVG